jgi:hypothetical protein
MEKFTKVVLFTDTDGKARFKEEAILMDEGTPQTQLTKIFSAEGYQLRFSPVGFRSQFHVTRKALWIFILTGKMEIGLQDGTSRIFHPGDHFYASDTLPEGETFDSSIHGHWSRQVGEEPLRTLSVKV